MTPNIDALSPAQKAAVHREMCRHSLLYFASEYLTGGVEHGNKFLVGQHHMEWDDLISHEERICILAPRNLAYPIWRGAYEPRGTEVYLFSANQDLANEFLAKIVNELTTNPKLAWLVPHNWEHTWAAKRIKLTTGVEFRARGFGVKVRGGHPKYIICDDMLGDENIYSETVREKAKDYFLSAITNMVIPGGQLIVVGTPMHQADVYAHLRKVKRYACWKRAAINRKTGEALWPARYNKDTLAAKKDEIGSVRFTREFLVEPFSDEMSMFPSHLFEGKPTQQHNIKLGMPAAAWEAMGVTSRYMGVDIAISASTGADYMVIFTLGKDRDGNRWVCDIQRERGLGFQAQLDLINTTARRMDPSMIFIESNQMQRVWGDELIRTTDLPIKKFTTTGQGTLRKTAVTQSNNKNSLEAGVPSLAPLLENGKFRIPRGDERSVELTEAWIHEMQAMSFVEGKVQSVGEHDDTVMACWIADQALRRGGFSASFGEGDVGDSVPQPRPQPAIQAEPPAENGSNPGGESGNLGGDALMGNDPAAKMLWSAVPFYRE
jgi:hypothetical protein